MEVIRDLLKALPEGANPGWGLEVDGQKVPAREASLVHPKFGEVRFGAAPIGGYGTWGFEEVGGGGSVLVPYFRTPEGQLYVGLVQQPRPFQSEVPVWNLPRGFLNPGQTHFTSALGEAREEVGSTNENRVFLLDGEPANPNSTFFVTRGPNADGSPKGIRFYGVHFDSEELERDTDGFKFKPGVVVPATKDAEKIMGCRFILWTEAMELGCMMTIAGVGRLAVYAYNCGNL